MQQVPSDKPTDKKKFLGVLSDAAVGIAGCISIARGQPMRDDVPNAVKKCLFKLKSVTLITGCFDAW